MKLHEAQNSWHSDNWTFKLLLLVVAMIAPFFIPQLYIQIYGMFLSHYSSVTFFPFDLICLIQKMMFSLQEKSRVLVLGKVIFSTCSLRNNYVRETHDDSHTISVVAGYFLVFSS